MKTDIDFLNSLALFMQDGGIFMWFILIPLILGLSICLERFLKLLVYDSDGSSIMNEIQKCVINGDIKEAMRLCSNSKALLPKVLLGGLKRANHETKHMQSAIDASALEVIPKVEKRLGYLGLLANISTLLGLLGTIYGLIQAFQAVGAADPAQKAQILAQGISKAMNTTAFGLITAIIIMVLNSILSAKAEKIITEIEEFSTKLLDLLHTRNFKNE